MAKAALHPNLQAVLNKVTGKSTKDFEKDLEREIILMGIREGKFSREDVLRHIRAGEIRPEVAKELQELWFKPAQPESKPGQPKPLGPQERLYLPIMRSLWSPDGLPPETLSAGDIVRQVAREYEKRQEPPPKPAKRTTILRIVELNRQGRYK